MTVNEKKEKLKSIIDNPKSSPVDIALALLAASTANIKPDSLEEILTTEQLLRVRKQMENYQNVYTYMDINDNGGFVLKQMQHTVADEPINKDILDPLTTLKFAEATIKFDMGFSIRANEYFTTSEDLKGAEHEFLKKLIYHISKLEVNNDLDEI